MCMYKNVFIHIYTHAYMHVCIQIHGKFDLSGICAYKYTYTYPYTSIYIQIFTSVLISLLLSHFSLAPISSPPRLIFFSSLLSLALFFSP